MGLFGFGFVLCFSFSVSFLTRPEFWQGSVCLLGSVGSFPPFLVSMFGEQDSLGHQDDCLQNMEPGGRLGMLWFAFLLLLLGPLGTSLSSLRVSLVRCGLRVSLGGRGAFPHRTNRFMNLAVLVLAVLVSVVAVVFCRFSFSSPTCQNLQKWCGYTNG